jgi:pimeloyl-ACP methyl ester carboxylesterase
LAVFALLNAPAIGQEKKTTPKDTPRIVVPKTPSFKHLDGQMLVFVANGVAGSTVLSDNLMELNGSMHLHLLIHPVAWTRHLAFYEDLQDHEAQLCAAARIAGMVTAIRKDAPNAHIYFAGHSAGARVVLAAAEMLPEKSIDRVILLSPAVSCTYDLTQALKTSRYGIDNFYSSEDSILDNAAERRGTADGPRGVPAAGRVGFRLVSSDKKDCEAYRALRQYRWSADLNGNGGHFTWTILPNLRRCVVPLFFSAPVEPPPIVEKKK